MQAGLKTNPLVPARFPTGKNGPHVAATQRLGWWTIFWKKFIFLKNFFYFF
jgi:hypothetical protein